MKQTRREKIAALAARPGTEAEGEAAKAALKREGSKNGSQGLPAIRAEEADDKWVPQARFARQRGGMRAFMYGRALAYLLEHTTEGEPFTARGVPQVDKDGDDDGFGQGDFYLCLSWLLKRGLAEKMPSGSRYVIGSHKAVRAAFNGELDAAKL